MFTDINGLENALYVDAFAKNAFPFFLLETFSLVIHNSIPLKLNLAFQSCLTESNFNQETC